MGNLLLILLMLATVLVLLAGIVIMARGKASRAKYSNKLMIARVALQALAIVLFVVLMLVRK